MKTTQALVEEDNHYRIVRGGEEQRPPMEDLLTDARTLHCVVIEAAARLERLLNVLDLHAAGVTDDPATHRPLAALAKAGQLETVLLALECLAERPSLAPAVLEVARGSSVEIVAKSIAQANMSR